MDRRRGSEDEKNGKDETLNMCCHLTILKRIALQAFLPIYHTENYMIIRNETASDIVAITQVTVAAFMHLEISNQTEHYIIHALRKAGALSLSLVAEINGKVVGHVAFSPVTISDGTREWYGLGPVSVLPGYQKAGIGTLLINEGLSRLKQMVGKGCVLVGDPGYYRRFGFNNVPTLVYEGIPQEFFMALPFNATTPQGTVLFHEGFMAES